MPENLQQSPKGEAAQAAIDAMENALGSIGEALDYINEAVE
jgi:hypothetical protein